LNFYHIVLVVVLTVISLYYIHYYRVVHKKPAQSILHRAAITNTGHWMTENRQTCRLSCDLS